MNVIWAGMRSIAITLRNSTSRPGNLIHANAKAAIADSTSGRIVEGTTIETLL